LFLPECETHNPYRSVLQPAVSETEVWQFRCVEASAQPPYR
jgi:hypothetical protein